MINAAVELTNNAEHYPGLCAMSHTYLRMPGPQFRQGDGGLRLEGGPLNKLWLLVIILHVQALAEQFCMKLHARRADRLNRFVLGFLVFLCRQSVSVVLIVKFHRAQLDLHRGT